VAITYEVREFGKFTPEELYELLRLRSEIFVVEQTCIYQDLDGKDKVSLHLMAKDGERIVGCIRLIPQGISYEEPSIGRLVVDEEYRKLGIARTMMERGIQYIEEYWNKTEIRISGQAYLRDFYESLGFRVKEGPYLEDDILHFQMLRTK